RVHLRRGRSRRAVHHHLARGPGAGRGPGGGVVVLGTAGGQRAPRARVRGMRGDDVISHLTVLGASGDLTGRYLLPALGRLLARGDLPDDLVLTGAARQDWDDDAFRAHAEQRLADHAADLPAPVVQDLLRRLRYRQA